MIEMIEWIDRRFQDRPDAGTFPQVVERLGGAPARLEEKTAAAPSDILTRRFGDAWTIQEHVGHLRDVEPLWSVRVDEFLAGEPELTAADMSNRRTREANHNECSIDDLSTGFRAARGVLVAKLETMDDSLVVREALHPRLQRSMRVIDLCVFVAEHDDHHLARMSELWRALTGDSAVLSLPPRSR